MLALSDADFIRLYTYIKKNYGIDLSKKKQLITSRLSEPLRIQGFASFTDYVNDIVSGRDREAVTAMLNRLTTNYTYFLREEEHFRYLKETVLPNLAKAHAGDHILSIWSAGCSSGEEPYTISIYLKEFFGPQASRWDTRILATDISQKILNKAAAASYPSESLDPLPAAWRQKYFVRQKDGKFRVSDAIRNNVIFRPFNLMDPIHFKRKFDLIFCRNVMIYFDQATKDALVRRFYDATVPGGYLFIGHSESLAKTSCPYRYIQPAIYQRPGGPGNRLS